MKKTIIALLSAVMFTSVCSALDMMDKQASKELNTALTQEKNKAEGKPLHAIIDNEIYKIIENEYPEFIDTEVFYLLKNIFKQDANFKIKTVSYVNKGSDIMPTITEIKINDKTYTITPANSRKTMQRLDLWKNPNLLNDFRKAYKNHSEVVKKMQSHLSAKMDFQYNTARLQKFSQKDNPVLLKDYKIPFKCSHQITFYSLPSGDNYLKCKPYYYYENGGFTSSEDVFVKYDAGDRAVFVDGLLFNANSPKNMDTELSLAEKVKYTVKGSLSNGKLDYKRYDCEQAIYHKEESGKFKKLSPEVKNFYTTPKLDCGKID